MAHDATDQSGEPGPKPWSHGMFYWNELMTRDADRACKFYGDSLGWSFDPMPMPTGGTYYLAKIDGQMVGGTMELNGPELAEMPEGWIAYIAVDDVDARVEKALKAGATLTRPIFDIPGIGRIAMLREPGGASIGWMTPARG